MSSSNRTKEELYIQNLREVKEVFDQYGIKFWLDTGTLLGAVRDKKVLSSDDDIDLSMRDSDYKKITLTFPKFREKDFIINEVPVPVPTLDFTHQRFSLSRFGYVIDIWSYCLRDDNYWTTFASSWVFGSNLIMRILSRLTWIFWRLLLSAKIDFDNKFKFLVVNLLKYCLFLFPSQFKKFLIKRIKQKLETTTIIVVVPRLHFERLERIEYYGMTFNIPSDVERYLEYRYGKDWKIPKKNWNWVKDDGSVRPPERKE